MATLLVLLNHPLASATSGLPLHPKATAAMTWWELAGIERSSVFHKSFTPDRHTGPLFSPRASEGHLQLWLSEMSGFLFLQDLSLQATELAD